MTDYLAIVNKYYKEDTPLRHILLTHSRQVALRALAVCDAHPELSLDRDFIESAAMLHDIGIVRCHAPGIHCLGTEPYIRHGLIGYEMLSAEGLDRHARVCSRHTGAGITLTDVQVQGLPLPEEDFLPESLEEQVICFADKFYSKSHLDHEKTLAEAERSLMKFGEAGVLRFRRWVEMFG